MKDWRDTHWSNNGETVWIADLITFLGNQVIEIQISDLPKYLPITNQERVDAANLDYPIIVLKNEGRYQYVLDGNHRLQQAIDRPEVESIKAKILDVSAEAQTPERFKRMFGGQNEEVIEEDSGVLSNIFKFCPAGTKCPPESKKTKWWKGR